MHERVTLGPFASDQWLHAPEHLAMVLARYRAAAALIGSATRVLEAGCGEGIGARILAAGRESYIGYDCDEAAIDAADDRPDLSRMLFLVADVLSPCFRFGRYRDGRKADAMVALDVIEHIADGAAFLAAIARPLRADGICVIGTPNAAFDHLASPQSKAAHVNTYTHDRLHALMSERFRVVQSFGMQDTALHLGHPEARHYLLMCGIGLR